MRPGSIKRNKCIARKLNATIRSRFVDSIKTTRESIYSLELRLIMSLLI